LEWVWHCIYAPVATAGAKVSQSSMAAIISSAKKLDFTLTCP
jgi:hypothetical protein